MRNLASAAVVMIVFVAGAAVASGGEGDERILRKEITIQAPLEEVWRAWTTEEGLAPVSSESNIELQVGGAYEWFLDLEPDENGLRGGQGSRVLAFLPGEVLAFDWTFPPSIPSLRAARAKTQVVIQFEETGPGVVRIRFAQLGWHAGEDWDRGYAYFDKAWDWVLQRMKESLEQAGGVEHQAVEVARGWLAAVDAGRYDESWTEAAGFFRDALTREQWADAMRTVRRPLGGLVSRELASARLTSTLPGAPDGEYVVVQFTTEFENKATAIETVTPMKDTDGAWRVAGYFIK